MASNSGRFPYASMAILMDTISRGFSYPVSDFYSDLTSGAFFQTLRQGCAGDDASSALAGLEMGIREITAHRDREGLESEYIALFEHNHRQEPLHLYCGLYLQCDGGRLENLQHLARLYRTYGLDMEDGAENADHLTVVLEFLSFLFRQAADLENKDDQAGLKQIASDICTVTEQLEWTKRLEDELIARGGHPFYLPLSRLLQSIL